MRLTTRLSITFTFAACMLAGLPCYPAKPPTVKIDRQHFRSLPSGRDPARQPLDLDQAKRMVSYNGIIDFNADVIPTRTAFTTPWRIVRTTVDSKGKPMTVNEQGQWVYNVGNGRWQLFITHANTVYPFAPPDFGPADTIWAYAPDGSEVDEGPVAVHKQLQHVGGYDIYTYSYTCEFEGELP